MIKTFTIEDRLYTSTIPDNYSDAGRLTWKNGHPGCFAVNPRGKQRFFPAKQIKVGRP